MSIDTKTAIRIKNKARYRDSKTDLVGLASTVLLTKPRIVTIAIDDGESVKVKGFSIVMAAEALGKSVIQLRAWIGKGYIPEPILLVRNHGYYVYDSKEMQIIRKHLYRHTKKGVSYLTKNSLDFMEGLNTDLWAYRGEHYGS